MKYELRLKPNFPALRRTRAGVTITKGESAHVELSKEQLDEVRADEKIVVREVKSTAKAESVRPAAQLAANAQAKEMEMTRKADAAKGTPGKRMIEGNSEVKTA